MQFSPRSVFLPFRSKYPPQHSVLKNPHCVPASKWELRWAVTFTRGPGGIFWTLRGLDNLIREVL
jgi:hypothetical protein